MESKVVVFWYWYNGDCFEVGGDNGLEQVELENVCEDISQLFCADPEHSARKTIRARHFMCIHPTQVEEHLTD